MKICSPFHCFRLASSVLLPAAVAFFLPLALAQAAPKALTPSAPATPSQTASQPPKPIPAPEPHPATAPPASQMIAGSAAARNQAILAHLNAVLRFWRSAESPIQKVGEPSDLIYRNQAVDYAAQIATDAFQSASAEAVLMRPYESSQPGAANNSSQGESERLESVHSGVTQRIADLKSQQQSLEQQIAAAHGPDAASLRQQLEQVQGELELQTAMDQALTRIASFSQSSTGTGLEADVQQLQRSAPDLTNPKSRLAAPALESVSSAHASGVTTQARVIFQLLSTRQDLDGLIQSAQRLHSQAITLRQPLEQMLRITIQKGEQVSDSSSQPAAPSGSATSAPASANSATPTGAEVRKHYDEITNTFKGLSAATVPLTQEILTLEEIQADLTSWRTAVNQEYVGLLTSLLARVAGIAIALAAIFGLGYIWRRATTRYVRDVRRRRQLMVMRRLVIGFLSGIVLIFGFVTQFSSLATFAGFITAGLAVGLQTILLSVAAYFFIIGRYGVRVGDRITVSGVTGDVIEVGLVRFYVLEMAASGSTYHSTGRVAVFSNAVLFQAGTPLYKQMPGTEYTWHQIVVKLDNTKDYEGAVKAMLDAVKAAYQSYSSLVDRQHQALESWMDASIDSPGIQSTLQLMDGGLQLWIRFPVVLRQSASQDEKMTQALLSVMNSNESVKAAVTAPPVIQPTMK